MFEVILRHHSRGQRVRAGYHPRRKAWGDEPFMPPFTSSRRETTRTAVRWPPFPENLEQGAIHAPLPSVVPPRHACSKVPGVLVDPQVAFAPSKPIACTAPLGSFSANKCNAGSANSVYTGRVREGGKCDVMGGEVGGAESWYCIFMFNNNKQ